MNLSFAGCGFLGIYHVGVAVCFKKYAPHLLLDKISGASAGALAACCLLCDLPLDEMTSNFFRIVNEARQHSLGPFSPSFNIQTCLLEGLQKYLPEDVHKKVNGRLHISLTRVYDGKNVIVSQYNSREDVLQALLCACFIPGFSGILPPRYHGVRYMDGAFSDNLPILDENTITVSPFCGESDICPRDQSSQLFHINWANTSIEISKQNINRFARILFPPNPQTMSVMCQQGFDDALQFLNRNNLINCTKCLAVQTTFIVSETITDDQDYDPECQECSKHRKDALIANMPETVLSVIQGYIDAANKGLASWLFRHKGFKLLHALSLPATVPVGIVYATFTKIISLAPSATQLYKLGRFILDQLTLLIKSKQQQKSKHMQANISCGITLTENTCNLKSSRNYGSKVSVIIDDDQSRYNDYSICHPIHATGFDEFDHILNVTSQHDAIYAYYYMDGYDGVHVTEIFDMTKTDETNRNDHINNDHKIGMEHGQPEYMYNKFYNTVIDEDPIIRDESDSYWPEVHNEDVPSDFSDPEADQSLYYPIESSRYNDVIKNPLLEATTGRV
uniref:triacylglycerol lipase n=1 Tax=Tabanus bromius TaxID=304241 RepID=A0A0K8TSE0_TABBR